MNRESVRSSFARVSALNLSALSCAIFACGAVACSSADKGGASTSDAPSGSEVAVSVVSGAINTNSGSGVAFYLPAPKASAVDRALAFLNPIGTAYAATWSCAGDTLSPAFSGPTADPYAFTPPSCSITWANGKSESSRWSGPFSLTYGARCDAQHPFLELQAGGCELTRTSATSGDARTITGPYGNQYAIDHDTNGAGTGWDSAVSPAPSNGGVQTTCAAGGCADGRTVVINGSHLTGTIDGERIWDHTVSSGAGGITVSGAGAARMVSGSVSVQHNLIRLTSTTTFDAVGYGEPLCCFPTTGSVSTTFSKGSNVGKTEKITFGPVCRDETLTRPDGVSEPLTLMHCL